MSETLTYAGTIVVVRCWCGIRHGIPEDLDKTANTNSDHVVYCPLGHKWVRSGPSPAEKEAKWLRETNAWLSARLTAEQDQRGAAERSNSALRGHLTRYRKRVANGVCPVAGCKRHFPNVQAHVATEHPDWLKDHAEVFDV